MSVLISRAKWDMPAADFRHRSAEEITRVVAHTEAGSALTDHARCDDRLRSIDNDHREHRGWAAIGYHRAICPHGKVYECRPLTAVGAHSEPANRNGIGVVFLGRPQDLTDDAGAAFLRLIREDETRVGRQLTVTTHRRVEPGSTECPGTEIGKLVDDIRAGRYKIPAPKPPKPNEGAPEPDGHTLTGKAVHKVRSGETLSSIAEHYLGDAGKWPAIQKRNKIKDPDSLTIGQKLVIP